VTTGADRRSVLTGPCAPGVAGCGEMSEIGGTRDTIDARREAVITDANRVALTAPGSA